MQVQDLVTLLPISSLAHVPGKGRETAHVFEMLNTHMENLKRFRLLVFIGRSPVRCGHLSSEPEDGRFLSLYISNE